MLGETHRPMSVFDTLVIILANFNESERLRFRLVSSVWSDAVCYLCEIKIPYLLILDNKLLSVIKVIQQRTLPNIYPEKALRIACQYGYIGLIRYLLTMYPGMNLSRYKTSLLKFNPAIRALRIARVMMILNTKFIIDNLIGSAIIHNDLEYVRCVFDRSKDSKKFTYDICDLLIERSTDEMFTIFLMDPRSKDMIHPRHFCKIIRTRPPMILLASKHVSSMCIHNAICGEFINDETFKVLYRLSIDYVREVIDSSGYIQAKRTVIKTRIYHEVNWEIYSKLLLENTWISGLCLRDRFYGIKLLISDGALKDMQTLNLNSPWTYEYTVQRTFITYQFDCCVARIFNHTLV